MTVNMVDFLIKPMEKNSALTLQGMSLKLLRKFQTNVSSSTIKWCLKFKMITFKAIKFHKNLIITEENSEKRYSYAVKLKKHQKYQDFIIYADETNHNLYSEYTWGQFRKGKQSIVINVADKDWNLQNQMVVHNQVGAVFSNHQVGSTDMNVPAGFFSSIYEVRHNSDDYRAQYDGEQIVLVIHMQYAE